MLILEALSKEMIESVSRILNLSKLNQPASVRWRMNDRRISSKDVILLHIDVKATNIQELKQDMSQTSQDVLNKFNTLIQS